MGYTTANWTLAHRNFFICYTPINSSSDMLKYVFTLSMLNYVSSVLIYTNIYKLHDPQKHPRRCYKAGQWVLGRIASYIKHACSIHHLLNMLGSLHTYTHYEARQVNVVQLSWL